MFGACHAQVCYANFHSFSDLFSLNFSFFYGRGQTNSSSGLYFLHCLILKAWLIYSFHPEQATYRATTWEAMAIEFWIRKKLEENSDGLCRTFLEIDDTATKADRRWTQGAYFSDLARWQSLMVVGKPRQETQSVWMDGWANVSLAKIEKSLLEIKIQFLLPCIECMQASSIAPLAPPAIFLIFK